MFSVWPKNQPKTTEIDFSRYFHFKCFPPLSHTRIASVKPSLLRPTHQAKWNDPHQRTTIAISPVTGTAPIDIDHDRDCDHRNQRDYDCDLVDRDRADRDLADRDRSEKICCPSGFYLSFWVLFEFLRMNDIMCLFGSWENVRKCEQQVKNVFSMVFSRIQPNIRKYFPKIFLKCNQTHENIFFSGK